MMRERLVNGSRIVLLGSRKSLIKDSPSPRVSVCRDRFEVAAVLAGPVGHVTWISLTRAFTDILLETALKIRGDLSDSRLLTLTPPRSESIPALLGLFHPVFGLVEGFRSLPKAELIKVVSRDDASKRFLGGSVDLKAKLLTLVRGDMTALLVPFSDFPKSGDGTTADFTRLGFTDYGQTIVLGDYEAASDAVLYEHDPDYRRKLNAERRESERTFGASLMRLRKQRRRKRSDFAPISAKEIARIERNEVGKPHARTLEAIAGKLDVLPIEIEQF